MSDPAANPKAEQAVPAAALDEARAALAKLPILGPALWLYARDPARKYMFLADIEVTLLPPILLDQCRLFSKDGIPFAFFTWARVSDGVDWRMRGGVLRIAPHEWKSGEHIWLMDAVAPFGGAEPLFEQLRREALAGKKIRSLAPDPKAGGKPAVKEWEPLAAGRTTH